MLKRTITAVVAVALFIPVCWFSDTAIFPLAMALLSAVGVYEMLGCVGVRKFVPVAVISISAGAVMPLLPYFLKESLIQPSQAVLSLAVLYLIMMYAADVLYRGKLDYTTTASAFMGVSYISLAFTSIVMLRLDCGKYFYLITFICPWVSDTFAYLFGRMLGKHKLIPEISPKKTVEGSVAGILFSGIAAAVFGFIIGRFFDISGVLGVGEYLTLGAAGMVLSVVSQIGDLSASAVKRRFGVKDYGFIFPGHGGVMDRFDSVLMTAPLLYIISLIPAVSGLLV